MFRIARCPVQHQVGVVAGVDDLLEEAGIGGVEGAALAMGGGNGK